MNNLASFPNLPRTETPKNISRFGGFIVNIFPSGDFSCGRSTPPKPKRESHPLDGIKNDPFGTVYAERLQFHLYSFREWVIRRKCLLANNPIKLADYLISQDIDQSLRREWCEFYKTFLDLDFDRPEISQETLSILCELFNYSELLGLSVVLNCHKSVKMPRVRRGAKGISTYAKRMVRSACAILEDRFGRRNIMLGAATLPVLSADDLAIVQFNWSNMVRKFFQELTRELARHGLSTDYVQVTEIQEKRYRRWDQICPHLHWICQGRFSVWEDHPLRPEDVAAIWSRIVSNALGKKLNCNAATRIEIPRKSLKGELSKYLSKGSEILKELAQTDSQAILPHSFWGATKTLKQEIKQSIKRLSGKAALDFIDNLQANSERGDLCFRPIVIQVSDDDGNNLRELTIGFVGFIKDRAIARLKIAA